MAPVSLSFFVLVPLLAFFLCCCFPKRWEKTISSIAISSVFLEIAMFFLVVISWWQGGFAPVAQSGLTLFASPTYTFALDFYMDLTSVVFFAMTCLTTLFVFLFSKFYMHRDGGFKRFYTTLLFFFLGLSLIIFSGNFETLFVGWEFIGISSFLLIAFYRDRFLPTKNGLKVFSLYRIADAFFLIGIWYAHHLFEKNIHFSEIPSLIIHHGNSLTLFGIIFLIVALIKSAQFPFSYWLPRAMEGPTTSSAIFYGALSVHIGLFLLMRTFPLWEGSMRVRALVILFGLATALVATSITRVQSSIKTQIAYASVTQIGIMFIELALGLHYLMLFHFISNACLRTYQLLISPSILSYLIHNQFYTFVVPAQKIRDTFMGRIRSTLYILSIKEWNMDTATSHLLWQPLKHIGQLFKFLDTPLSASISVLLFLGGAYVSYGLALPHEAITWVIYTSGIISLIFFIRAYTTKGRAQDCWTQIFLGQLFAGLLLSLASGGSWENILLYASGITVAFIIGIIVLSMLGKKGESYMLIDFHGQMYANSMLGNIFLLACLSMMVFPITPSFLGEEILLSMIHQEHVAEIIIFGVGYALSGISLMRLFAKVFFGPHKKTYHEIAYRSS